MKNKMKKLISKITILVLLVAMVIPYTNIPKVEAATEECPTGTTPEYHTNYYFFLQAETPWGWTDSLAQYNGKISTSYYTSFLYNFPSDGSKIIFEDQGFVKITEGSRQRDFDAGSKANRKAWTVGDYYYQTKTLGMDSVISSLEGYVFESNDTGASDEDRIITYLFHGDWANLNEELAASKEKIPTKMDLNRLDMQSGSLNTTDEKIVDLVNSSILINKNDSSLSNVSIGAAYIGSGNIELSIEEVKNSIINYNNFKSNPDYKETRGGTIEYIDDIKQPVINMAIHREYRTSDIFVSGISLTKTSNTINATYGGNAITLNYPDSTPAKITFTNSNNVSQDASFLTSIVMKDDKNQDVSWFLAPTLYQISYKVCKSSGSDEDKVTLTYKGNEPENATEDAKDIPDAVTKDKGSEFKTSDKTPTLKGYKFDSWNIDPKCDGESYEPDYDLGELNSDLTLHACWKSTDGTKGPGTGVLTYTGLFTGIIALAGGSYYIMKKKNLFRQI